jgi:septum formation protein
MAEQPPFRLILASGSAGRRYLLSRAGYAFDVIPSNVDEPDDVGFTDAQSFVQHVAWLKAAAVALRLTAESACGPTVVLAADTVGWLHGRAIGKPADEADARRILRLLTGTEHELWTGVCLWRLPDGLQVAWQEVSRVAMKDMTEAELDSYLATRVWQGCSGAYAIREDHDAWVRVVQGSVSNVIGLPMETLECVLPGLVGLNAHGS